MSPRRLGLAVAALTALLWAIDALAPPQPVYWSSLDLHWYFFPVYAAFYGALRAGAPLLWNPYQLCGMPWLGTLQGGFFYPPHVLYLLLPTAWALGTSTVLHVGLAAGGTAAFARRAGLSPAAATLAAAVFAFAGTFRRMQLWPYFIESCAWLPFGAMAIMRIADGQTARGALGLALASGMSWLAGCPQGTLLACYGWAALFSARLVCDRPTPRVLARSVGGLIAGLGAGGLLGAVSLAPGWELAREGVRRAGALNVDYMYPLGIPEPSLIWADWVGSGARVLPFVALPLAPLALLSSSRALMLWGLGVAALAAGLALGPTTPLFRLYLLLPLLGWFRMPHRVLMVGQFALGTAAALGLDAAAARLRWRPAAPLVLLGVLATMVVAAWRTPPPGPPLPYRRDLVPWVPAQREAYARLATTIGDARVWPFTPGVMQFGLPPKLPTLARLRSIEDYEPLTLRRQQEYFVYLAEGALPSSQPRDRRIEALRVTGAREQPAARRRLLDLAAVRFLLMRSHTRRRPDVLAFVRDARLEPRPALVSGVEVVENPHVLPRAFVTYRARPAPAAVDLLPLLARESFDPLAESWVEGDAGLPAGADAPPRGTAASIVRDDPQVVEVDATLAAPGLVVLADTFYPGWTATVDGAPAPILATNHLFRGVPTPAGSHRIRFAYRPRSLALGGAVSLLTALVLAVGVYRLKTRPAA